MPDDSAHPVPISGAQPGLSVLVVEDDPAAARSYATLLSVWGHRVRKAADVPAALRLAAAELPDVALIDIRLPGMDGRAIARELVRPDGAGRRPLLVAITAYDTEEDALQSLLAGFDLHVGKPVDPEKLHRLLARFEQVVAPAEPAVVADAAERKAFA